MLLRGPSPPFVPDQSQSPHSPPLPPPITSAILCSSSEPFSSAAMGQAASQSMSAAPSAPASCPIDHSAAKASVSSASSGPAKCPIDHTKVASSSTAPQPPAQCPISHDAPADGINPLNQMPTLSQAPAAHQEAALPTDRETSTIPRDDGARWEYPSPQQFYNALVRKGWETPEEHVETMVQIHNFLNEQAWLEILKWEKKELP